MATDAKLSWAGKVCKAEALKAGHKIRVTTKTNDRSVATVIESLNQNANFTQSGSGYPSTSDGYAETPGLVSTLSKVDPTNHWLVTAGAA